MVSVSMHLGTVFTLSDHQADRPMTVCMALQVRVLIQLSGAHVAEFKSRPSSPPSQIPASLPVASALNAGLTCGDCDDVHHCDGSPRSRFSLQRTARLILVLELPRGARPRRTCHGHAWVRRVSPSGVRHASYGPAATLESRARPCDTP